MKALHVITGLNVGGAETMLAKLIEAGADTRGQVQPAVVSMLKPGAMAARITSRGVPVHTLGMRRGVPSPAAALTLMRIARSVAPDIVQGWMYHGNLAATVGALALDRRPPLVWNVRHSLSNPRLEKRSTRILLRLSALLSKIPAAIIYNSRTAARQHEAIGFAADRTIVIPNGFDCDKFRPRPEARAELCRMFGIDERAIIVGMVARFHPMKDHALLVEAVSRARLAGRDLHLLLVGTGLDQPPAQLAKAVALALPANRVTFVGERHDVSTWLPGLDILALSSAWGEGFPNILGEAMACGVPCVATDLGDSGWIMGEGGWAVPAGEPEAMSQALTGLADAGPSGRRRMGEIARARVVALFSLAHIDGEYRLLYERVLDRANRSLAVNPNECAGSADGVHTT